MLIAFHKPFGVISQFTPDGSPHRTLADFGFPANLYPIGRLDAESEGLLLLSDEPGLNTQLLHPTRGHRRIYWAQVEREPSPEAIAQLERGVIIRGYQTLPCKVRRVFPEVPPRVPPIRYRKNVPDSWLEMELTEGKNHQVRKMTAAVGHPTLRLIRVRIGLFPLDGIKPGTWRELRADERAQLLR